MTARRYFEKAVACAALGVALAAGTVRGAGLLIADGGLGGVLQIKEHDVQVTIDNGVAVTKVTQVFHNTEARQVEALYTFPVPKGASVANFSMWINGKEMTGEVVEKERARQIYNNYKQQKRDPGLLEQKDYKTFEMRVFPIAANADQKVEVAYYQELDVDHDWATYTYPLATATRQGVDDNVQGRFAIDVQVKSAIPIAEAESPSHGDEFAIAKHTADYVQAGLEKRDGSLARDVVVAYRLERPKTGVDIVTSKLSGEDGYFLLTLTAGEDLAQLDKGMDYVFVLDVSGSMANDGKLLVSRESVAAFIAELSPEDRFEVITFNVSPSTGFNALRAVDEKARTDALSFLDAQRAKGGTVLKPALDVAYRYADPDRPLNVVILSDGMTEQAERAALLQLIKARPAAARVFCIGVGNEVNRPLLEQLAADSGGLAAFVSRDDNFTRAAKAFRRKLMRPAVADVSVDFGGGEVYDVEPRVAPNLYHGSPIRLYGRYKGTGPVEISVKGTVQGATFKQSATLDLPREDAGHPEIERMWAWHRVDRLQKDADRSGSRDSVIGDIVRLGEGYSIVTEYTSFLVLENDAEYQRWKIDRRNALRTDRDRRAEEARRAELESIRGKASADLGPAPTEAQASQASTPTQAPAAQPLAQTPSTATPAPSTQNRGTGIDFDIGTGPVGPLFVLAAAWLARRRMSRA
jgi:Ca-activated chloride channel homolog